MSMTSHILTFSHSSSTRALASASDFSRVWEADFAGRWLYNSVSLSSIISEITQRPSYHCWLVIQQIVITTWMLPWWVPCPPFTQAVPTLWDLGAGAAVGQQRQVLHRDGDAAGAVVGERLQQVALLAEYARQLIGAHRLATPAGARHHRDVLHRLREAHEAQSRQVSG